MSTTSGPFFLRTIALRTVAVLAVAYVLLNLGIAIRKNYTVNESIRLLKRDIATLQSRITFLHAKLVYLQSSAYRELEVKRRLALKRTGEQVVLVPSNKSATTAPAVSEPTLLTVDQADASFASVFERASANAATWLRWFTDRE